MDGTTSMLFGPAGHRVVEVERVASGLHVVMHSLSGRGSTFWPHDKQHAKPAG
jgi:hypothetical protein